MSMKELFGEYLDEEEGEEEEEDGAKDVQELTTAWINEKFAPEILPFKQEAVDRLMELLIQQVFFYFYCVAITNKNS